MKRPVHIRQLGRLRLTRNLNLLLCTPTRAQRIDNIPGRESEAAESQRFGVELGALHDGFDGGASPVADVEPGAVGQLKGLGGAAAGALCCQVLLVFSFSDISLFMCDCKL